MFLLNHKRGRRVSIKLSTGIHINLRDTETKESVKDLTPTVSEPFVSTFFLPIAHGLLIPRPTMNYPYDIRSIMQMHPVFVSRCPRVKGYRSPCRPPCGGRG